MDEERLIKQAQSGDVHAYNRLVLAYQDIAYNVAYRILGDPAAASDATQDAFISAYKALGRFKQNNFKAWLLRIVHNKCLDALRKQKRHPEPSLDALTEEFESPSFLRDKTASPEAEAERGELVEAIEACLRGLGADQRAAVVLCDVENYDYSEIAQILSVSLGTVKSRINRGRRKLQDCLRNKMELLPKQYR